MQEVWVWSPVGELRSYMLHSETKKKKKNNFFLNRNKIKKIGEVMKKEHKPELAKLRNEVARK